MSGTEKSHAILLDELAALDPAQRREVAHGLREVAETFAEVPDGSTASRFRCACSSARPRLRVICTAPIGELLACHGCRGATTVQPLELGVTAAAYNAQSMWRRFESEQAGSRCWRGESCVGCF
jgi:hypothetical protein